MATINLKLTDEQRALRTGVAEICKRYPGEYWRDLDSRREYPEKFVNETRISVVAAAGGSADNDSQSIALIKTVLTGGRRDPQNEYQKHVSRCFECSASHVFFLD